MLRFGPLRHQWCMRFEAKNAYIKGLVGKNSKNLPYTIAERHQNYMCLCLLSPPGSNSMNYLYRGDEIGNGTEANIVFMHIINFYQSHVSIPHCSHLYLL